MPWRFTGDMLRLKATGSQYLQNWRKKWMRLILDRAQAAERKAREILKSHFGEDEVEIQRMLKYESKLKRALVRQSATQFK